MRNRENFNKQCNAILDIMDIYEVMKRTHLDAMFPSHEREISYLVKNKRLCFLFDGVYLGQNETAQPDKHLMAAVDVLINVFSKVTHHSTGTFPVQVLFTTTSGDYYEIVYVEQGKEALVSAAFKAQGVDNSTADATKRLVIIEDITQAAKVKAAIPNISRFALLDGDGFMYFINS